MYTIKVTYQTGDSFKSFETSDQVGIVWTSLDKAKEALRAIKEHNEYYKSRNRHGYVGTKYTKTYLKAQPWWNPSQYDKLGEYSILVANDDGKMVPISAFWTGYFENLHLAEIIVDDEDMRYKP
jgi:hypothetical protein